MIKVKLHFWKIPVSDLTFSTIFPEKLSAKPVKKPMTFKLANSLSRL